jgi:hypothetical protein
MELDNKNLMKENSEKEIAYVNRIKELELKILSSDKADLIILQRTNKDNEIMLNNLNKSYQNLQTKFTESSHRFTTLSEELLVNKQNILFELEQLEKFKLRLREHIPEKQEKKNEVLIKYNKPLVATMKPINNNNTRNLYNIRRSNRFDVV